MTARTILSSLALALSVSFVVPATALAAPGKADQAGPADDRGARGERGERREKLEKAFPMEAAKFKQHLESRITKTRERVIAKLDKSNAPADVKKAVIDKLDQGAAKIRAAADEAMKDGTVTLDEAKTVRTVAKEQKASVREAAKGHLRGHGKGKGKGHGKSDA
jgi:hypothetical protein